MLTYLALIFLVAAPTATVSAHPDDAPALSYATYATPHNRDKFSTVSLWMPTVTFSGGRVSQVRFSHSAEPDTFLPTLVLMPFVGAAPPVSSPALVYATYVNNGPGSVVTSLAVDSAGYVYAAGGGPAYSDPHCAYVKKLNQTGTGIVWSVCLPVYQVNAIALDAAGYIYVAGQNQQQYGSGSTVMKLSPSGQQTVYSTSLPFVAVTQLALDGAGNVYLTGTTNNGFQATGGAYLAAGLGGFAMKLDTTGSVSYATALDMFAGDGVAVDGQGEAWIVGTSCPAPQSTCNFQDTGAASAIRKLDASGSHLLVTRTFGGGTTGDHGRPYVDSANGVAVDTATGSVWIVGAVDTWSVPISSGAIEPQRPPTAPPGRSVGYAIKLSPTGDLLYGTYVGGANNIINSVAVDSAGDPYFALDSELLAMNVAAISALSPDGSRVLTSASLVSPVQAIALDGQGGLYVAGSTDGFLMTTGGAYQPLFPGCCNSGFAAKFDLTANQTAHWNAYFNAAGLKHGWSMPAPGEILSLFGANLPPNPKVTFDDVAAPVLYADANQINLVVPFAVSPPSTVFSVQGVGDYYAVVWPASPGLFTVDNSGAGQLAALNQDGSVNSSVNPAKAGSIVSVFLTGAGKMTPPIADGQLGPLQPPYPAPVMPVSATVGGADATILFAGQAPLLVAGVVQVNLQIPAGTLSGNAAVVVYIGYYSSQFMGTTTIAVQ